MSVFKMSKAALVFGALSWSASEYAIHRFIGHGPRRRVGSRLLEQLTPSALAARFNEEHVAHHTDPSYFAPSSHKLVAATLALGLVSAAGSVFFGPRRAVSFGAGFAAAYLGYEVLHRRIHTAPPRGRFGRWARRHHLLHHHKSPSRNHGVTSPLFDHLFDTRTPLERVKIPRQSPPRWLVDTRTGEVKAEYAEDYVLTRRPAESKPHEPKPHDGP